jgi:hypothetical protein
LAAALGATTAFLIAAPTRGQQGAPALNLTVPTTASGGADTRVSITYTLPPGVQLQRNPRLRITDTKGQLFELLPTHITPGAAVSTGYRDLHTELYPPGIYQVWLEVLYAAPGGKTITAASPATTLTVPAR